MSLVSQNLSLLQQRIATASRGRKITIVGATKSQPQKVIQEALDAGLSDLGVNYAQDGAKLREEIKGGRWHFIGQIQSRKVKLLTDYACIQSLDRIEIIGDLHKRLEALDRTVDGLIEVNIGAETSKSGIPASKVADFRDKMSAFPRVRCRGMMVMPPPLMPVEKRRVFFQRAKALFDSLDAPDWDCLSMGTSDDFEIAVAEGATMIRLGTVLFGTRT